jgi:hypothetical protein
VTNSLGSDSFPQVGVLCPQCQKDDQLQRISTIVDTGTSQTTGVGIGAIIAGARGQHPIGVAGYASSNSSQLAKRLGGAPEPRFSFAKAILILWALISIVLVPVLLSLDSDSPLWVIVALGIFFSFWGGLLLSIPVLLIGDLSLRPARARWRQRMEHIRSAYYCHRDDLVVAMDGSGSPEQYVAWCFSQR